MRSFQRQGFADGFAFAVSPAPKIYARGVTVIAPLAVKNADPKSRTSHVRFGSLADIDAQPADVRLAQR